MALDHCTLKIKIFKTPRKALVPRPQWFLHFPLPSTTPLGSGSPGTRIEPQDLACVRPPPPPEGAVTRARLHLSITHPTNEGRTECVVPTAKAMWHLRLQAQGRRLGLQAATARGVNEIHVKACDARHSFQCFLPAHCVNLAAGGDSPALAPPTPAHVTNTALSRPEALASQRARSRGPRHPRSFPNPDPASRSLPGSRPPRFPRRLRTRAAQSGPRPQRSGLRGYHGHVLVNVGRYWWVFPAPQHLPSSPSPQAALLWSR